MKVAALLGMTALASTGSATSEAELPLLNVDGFAWAENLAFDGYGNLFVSEAVRGELWKITLNANGTAYDAGIHLTDGVSQFGGLQISPDGSTVYAGATLPDDSHALLSTSATVSDGTFEVVVVTKNQANGLACDFSAKICYMTDEGTGSDEGGTVVAVDLSTGLQTTIKDHVQGANGAWLDEGSQLLFVGELISKKINVFDTSQSPAAFTGVYTGLNDALGQKDLLDDLCLVERAGGVDPDDLASTLLLGADWTGRTVQKFSLDGTSVGTVPVPEEIELKEATSVRWGKGPGFDEKSIYVTEGGGATPHVTNRRVVQIKMMD